MIVLTLPWAPSVNAYWRHIAKWPLAGRVLISEKGRNYRTEAVGVMLDQLGRYPRLSGRLAVTLAVNPPDRRRRDLDNMPKAILDALTHAQVILDDSQIDDLHIVRGPPTPGGCVVVSIKVIQDLATAA
jgi:crossover junction endodeoxyribonuclease RusA